MGLCNLSELNIEKIKDQKELNDAVKTAAFIGTLQAGYTDFFYLRDGWRKTAERDALLGVSLTGIASQSDLSQFDFNEAARVAVTENERVSALIGINKAKRVTTVKPSGTSSLVLKTSSGVHAWHSPFYIRRMRFNKAEAIALYLKERLPALVVDSKESPGDTCILEIPVKAPEGGIMRNESALDLLKRVSTFNTTWIKSGHIEGENKHNVSCTISVKNGEWPDVREWMWDNRRDYGGIALFPFADADYPQLPFEEITEERYNEMLKDLHEIDITQILEDSDDTDLKGELACAGGGGCEVT